MLKEKQFHFDETKKHCFNFFSLSIVFLKADFFEDCEDFGNSALCLVRKNQVRKFRVALSNFRNSRN